MEHETLTLRAEGEDEDDDEDDEDMNDDEIVQNIIEVNKGHKKRYMTCLKSRPCTVCLYLTLVLFLLSSVVTIIVVGILIGAPYHHVNGYTQATCLPESIIRDTSDRRCSCGKGCQSQYPVSKFM